MSADDRALAGEKIQNARRNAGFLEHLHQFAATIADCSAGFMMTVLPVTSAAVTIPVKMASGKFHGAMTSAMPRGQ